MTLVTYTPKQSILLREDGSHDYEYLISSVISTRVAFQNWVKDMTELREIESTRPIGYSGSAVISAVASTMLQDAQSPYTEWVSGRLYTMRQNYVGRMINSPCSIEAEQVSSDMVEEARREALLSVCNGVLHDLDQRTQHLGMGTSWRRLVAESSAFPGKIIGIPWVKRGRDGQAVVECELWDPLTVWHDFNTWPRRVVHEWRTGAMNAHKWLLDQRIEGQPGFEMPMELKIEKPDQVVTLSEIWIEEPSEDGPDEFNVWRGVLVDNHVAGLQLTGFAHLPIVIISTHANVASYQSMAMLAGGDAASPPDFRGVPYEAILNHAQPFYASLKHTHEQFKVMVSAIMEGLAKNLNPAEQIASERGNIDIEESKMAAGGRFRTDLNTKVIPLNSGIQQIAEAVKICVQMFETEFNNVYDPSLMGKNDQVAGFALMQIISHAKTVLNEPASGCAAFVHAVFTEVLHQLQRSNLKFRARDIAKVGNSGPSPLRDYGKADLPQDITLDVEWLPDIGDIAQMVDLAQNHIGLGLPPSEVWRRDLGIKNSQELMERADQEKVRQDPRVQAMNVVQYFLEKWLEAQDFAKGLSDPRRKRAAQTAADYYKRMYASTEAQLMPPPQSGQQPPGQGTPPGAPGMGPELLPPEARIGMNPDLNAAAKNKQSSAAGGQGAVGVLGEGGGAAPTPAAPQVLIRNGKPMVRSVGGVLQ